MIYSQAQQGLLAPLLYVTLSRDAETWHWVGKKSVGGNSTHVTQRHISTNPKTVGLAVISLESE